MDLLSLAHFARIKPLIAWSISGSVLGLGLALYISGGRIVAVLPTALAMVAVVLMQYAAHPLNDIMDCQVDRQAPIGATGRVKPLVSGAVTVSEAKHLTTALVLIILAILAYLIYLRPPLILPAAYGMAALMGYNHPAARLAYHPFTELYMAVPVNAIVVFVTSYIGSGAASPVAAAVSVIFGFASSAVFVSMMSMDLPTDLANGKVTTVSRYPRSYWCAIFPGLGLAAAAVSPLLLYDELGPPATALFLAVSILAFVPIIAYGLMVDQLRHRYLRGEVRDPEGRAGRLRLRQLYISSAFAFVLAALFASRSW